MIAERLTVVVGTRPFDVEVVRSQRRTRTLSLNVSDNGALRVLAPSRTSRSAIEDLVRRHTDWIDRRLEQLAQPADDGPPPIEAATELPIYGQLRPVVEAAPIAGDRAFVELASEAIRFHFPLNASESQKPALRRQLLIKLYGDLTMRSVRATALDQPEGLRRPSDVLIVDNKRRWASCSSDGKLRFCWRVALLDEPLMEYILVHELCHLYQMNHSKAFWAEVERSLPNFRERRAKLRQVEKRLPR